MLCALTLKATSMNCSLKTEIGLHVSQYPFEFGFFGSIFNYFKYLTVVVRTLNGNGILEKHTT